MSNEKENFSIERAALIQDRMGIPARKLLISSFTKMFGAEDDPEVQTLEVLTEIFEEIPKFLPVSEIYPLYGKDTNSGLILGNLTSMSVKRRISWAFNGDHYFGNIIGQTALISEYSANFLSRLTEYDLYILHIVGMYMRAVNMVPEYEGGLMDKFPTTDSLEILMDILRVENDLSGYDHLFDSRDIILEMSTHGRAQLFHPVDPYNDFKPETAHSREKITEFKRKGVVVLPELTRENRELGRKIASSLGRAVEKVLRQQITGINLDWEGDLDSLFTPYFAALDIESIKRDGSFKLSRSHFENPEGINASLIEETADLLTYIYIHELSVPEFYKRQILTFEQVSSLPPELIQRTLLDMGLSRDGVTSITKAGEAFKEVLGKDNAYLILDHLKPDWIDQIPESPKDPSELILIANEMSRQLLDPNDAMHSHLKKVMYGLLTFARLIKNPIPQMYGFYIKNGIPGELTDTEQGHKYNRGYNKLPDAIIVQPRRQLSLIRTQDLNQPMFEFTDSILSDTLKGDTPIVIVEIKYRSEHESPSTNVRKEDVEQLQSYFDALKDLAIALGAKSPESLTALLIVVTPSDTSIMELETQNDLKLSKKKRRLSRREMKMRFCEPTSPAVRSTRSLNS